MGRRTWRATRPQAYDCQGPRAPRKRPRWASGPWGHKGAAARRWPRAQNARTACRSRAPGHQGARQSDRARRRAQAQRPQPPPGASWPTSTRRWRERATASRAAAEAAPTQWASSNACGTEHRWAPPWARATRRPHRLQHQPSGPRQGSRASTQEAQAHTAALTLVRNHASKHNRAQTHMHS